MTVRAGTACSCCHPNFWENTTPLPRQRSCMDTDPDIPRDSALLCRALPVLHIWAEVGIGSRADQAALHTPLPSGQKWIPPHLMWLSPYHLSPLAWGQVSPGVAWPQQQLEWGFYPSRPGYPTWIWDLRTQRKGGMMSKLLLLRLFLEEHVHWRVKESLGSLWEVALGQAEGTATPVYDFQ